MRIVGFRHKDLERLWRHGEVRGVARQHEAKLRAMLTALEEAENIAELETIPGWRLHPLKGSRKGVWSLTVRLPATIRKATSACAAAASAGACRRRSARSLRCRTGR
jgi:proteic killer suppression protein